MCFATIREMGCNKSEKGQAVFVIGLLSFTFLLFFAFVINIGMLVNAKINLQNAADVAAYAGAAVQARQMNHIGFLNYEMRRQYKKFLFRYHVLGNMAQYSHPKTLVLQKVPRQWSPNGGVLPGSPPDPNQQDLRSAVLLDVPTVCFASSPGTDNFCKKGDNLKAIPMPSTGFTDNITQTLRDVNLTIEGIRQNNCRAIAKTNRSILMAWLMNPTLDANTLNVPGNDPDLAQILQRIRGMTFGLGLIPRQALLRKRIDTLADFINTEPGENLTKSRIDQLNNNVRLRPKFERTIQAFLSAFYSLGPNTFSEESIVMDELLPQVTQAGEHPFNMMKLQDINAKFDAFYTDFSILGSFDSNNTQGRTNPSDCKPALVAFPLPATGIPIGVAKEPDSQVYYAVRLQARAKVLFNIFGPEILLKAYAAAKPFGSRIGPPLSDDDTSRESRPTSFQIADANLFRRSPNLAIFADDPDASRGKGWDSLFAISTFFQELVSGDRVPGDVTLNTTLNFNDFIRASQVAMAPNPAEAGQYLIPNDLSEQKRISAVTPGGIQVGEPFKLYFTPYTTPGSSTAAPPTGLYSFWAPLTPTGDIGAVQNLIDDIIQSITASNTTSNQLFSRYIVGLRQGLGDYLNKLQQGEGEDAESFTIARIPDPFQFRRIVLDQKNIRSTGLLRLSYDLADNFKSEVFMESLSQVRSSFGQVKDGFFETTGRVGYSVKFVPLQSLTEGLTNRIPTGGDTGQDLSRMKH